MRDQRSRKSQIHDWGVSHTLGQHLSGQCTIVAIAALLFTQPFADVVILWEMGVGPFPLLKIRMPSVMAFSMLPILTACGVLQVAERMLPRGWLFGLRHTKDSASQCMVSTYVWSPHKSVIQYQKKLILKH